MRPHILYRTISETHLSAYLIHLRKVAIFDTNLISVGCVQHAIYNIPLGGSGSSTTLPIPTPSSCLNGS